MIAAFVILVLVAAIGLAIALGHIILLSGRERVLNEPVGRCGQAN